MAAVGSRESPWNCSQRNLISCMRRKVWGLFGGLRLDRFVSFRNVHMVRKGSCFISAFPFVSSANPCMLYMTSAQRRQSSLAAVRWCYVVLVAIGSMGNAFSFFLHSFV